MKIPFLTNFVKRAVASSLAQAFVRGLDLDVSPSKLTRPYAQSAWVHAAINRVTQPISSIDLYFCDLDGEEIQDDRLAAFWEAPALNPDFTRMNVHDFIEALASWLLISGEFFLILDDTYMLPFPDVAPYGGFNPLIIARPDHMRHVIENGQLVRWEYCDASGRRNIFETERVIQVKLFNPYDPWRGLGPMESAMIAAGADYAAGTFAKNVAENNGDQGVYIVAKNGIPTDPQREQIINQLKEKRAAQQRGIFRPIFLTGDISIEDPQVRSVDAAFVAQRTEARKEIAIAFGVPPSFFDPVASYSVGSASDRYILIEETCKPLSNKICSGITAIARRQVTEPLRAELDWDDHSVMQQVRRERLDSATKLWGVGMPMKNVNDYLALDMDEFPGWDVGYLPFSVAPTTEATQPGPEPSDYSETPTPPADNQPDDAIGEMMRALKGECGSHRAPKNARLWQSHMAVRRKSVKLYQSKISKVLNFYRARALQRLPGSDAKALKSNPIAITRSLVDIIFDSKEFGRTLINNLEPIARAVLQTAGEELLKEIDREDDPWKMPPQDALRFINSRETLIQGVGETARAQLNTAIEAAIKEGKSIDEIADVIRSTFNNLSHYEARRIAMTETGAAYGFARDKAMRDAGVQYKSWLSSHGPNVRPAHAAAEAEYESNPIPIDEPFIVDGEELMFPGDPSGSPGNVINCQCVQLAVAPPNKES